MSAGVEAGRDVLSVARDVVALTKPRVTALLVVTIAAGAFAAPGAIYPVPLVLALFGTALVMGSANALNMYLERDVDAEMERTCMRPLPTGRLAPDVALWLGVVLGLTGLFMLTLLVNPLTGILAALALASYTLAYTPLKRVTPLAVWVGALPGALPPLIGWASTAGRLSVPAWTVFAILFVWQIPHFLAIAIFRQRDYERAGLKVMPAVRGLPATKRTIVWSSALLLVTSMAPVAVGLAGPAYAVVAGAAGAPFLYWAVRGLGHSDTTRWARKLFFASMPYLVVVYAALVVATLGN